MKRHWRSLTAVLLFFLLINVAFVLHSPEELVQQIGVKNSYLVVFLIAAFGGLSTLTSSVLYATIVTTVAGGANAWLIGICGGLGIAIGDILIFSLLQYGYRSVPERFRTKILPYRLRWKQLPAAARHGLVYLYLGFTPLPNDLLMVTLVLLGYRLRYLIPIAIAGGITIATIVAQLGGWWLS